MVMFSDSLTFSAVALAVLDREVLEGEVVGVDQQAFGALPSGP